MPRIRTRTRVTAALLVALVGVLTAAASPLAGTPPVPIHLSAPSLDLGAGIGASLAVTANDTGSTTLSCVPTGLSAGQRLRVAVRNHARNFGYEAACDGTPVVIPWGRLFKAVTQVEVSAYEPDPHARRTYPESVQVPGTREAIAGTVSFPVVAPGDGPPAAGVGPAWYRAWRGAQAASNAFQAAAIGNAAAAYTLATGGDCWTLAGLRTCHGGWGHLYSLGGTTWGTTYVASPGVTALMPQTIRHEAVHRYQWRLYGAWFAVMYLHAGNDHDANRFERQAGDVGDTWSSPHVIRDVWAP